MDPKTVSWLCACTPDTAIRGCPDPPTCTTQQAPPACAAELSKTPQKPQNTATRRMETVVQFMDPNIQEWGGFLDLVHCHGTFSADGNCQVLASFLKWSSFSIEFAAGYDARIE